MNFIHFTDFNKILYNKTKYIIEIKNNRFISYKLKMFDHKTENYQIQLKNHTI